jgi:hypothetical protein
MSSGELSWELVVSLANDHLVTAWLWISLQQKGLTDSLPEEVRVYLSGIHQLTTERNERIRSEAKEALRCLNHAGITPILLKGGAQLLLGRLPDIGAKLIQDLDFLVRLEEEQQARKTLMEQGYVEMPESHSHGRDAHGVGLINERSVAPIELHTNLLHDNDPRVVSLHEIFSESEPMEVDSRKFFALSPTHQALYNIVHSEIRHERYSRGSVGVWDMLELAAMAPWISEGAHWDWILFAMRRHGLERMCDAYCFMVEKLFGVSIPSMRKKTLAARIHYARCMLQVAFFKGRLSQAFVEVCYRFSATHIQRRYGRADSFAERVKFRVHRLLYMCNTYLLGRGRRRLRDLLKGK